MTHTSTEQPEALRLAEELRECHPSKLTELKAASVIISQHARILELEAAQARANSAIEEALQLQQKFYGHGADTLFALDNWAKKYKDAITQEKQG